MHLFSRWSKREGSTRRRGGGKGGGEGCEDGSARRWTPPHLPGLRGALSLSVQMWVSSSWPGTNQEVTTSHAASTWGPRHFRYSLLPLYLVRFSTIRAVISATGLDLISIFFASNGRRGWWTVCVTQIHNFLGELEKFSNSSQV